MPWTPPANELVSGKSWTPPADELQSKSDSPQSGGMLAGTPLGGLNISGPNWNKDLLTNDKVGFGGNMIRSIPSMVLGAASLGNPVGFGAGEALRQGAVGVNAAMGNTQAPTLTQAIGSPALAGAGAYAGNLASPYISKALVGGTLAPAEASQMTQIPFSSAQLPGQQALTPLANGETGGALGAIGRGVGNVMQYARENYAGVKAASSKFAQQFPDLVSKYLGATPEVGDQLAQSAQTAIDSTVAQHEAQYPALIEAARNNPAYQGKTFNLASDLGSTIDKIASKYQFAQTGRIAPAEGATAFNAVADQFKKLPDATLDEVYGLQKALTGEAGSAFSSNRPLGSAFGELKDEVTKYLGKNIPEIGQGNQNWAIAKALQENTAKVANANDPLKYITKTMNEVQNTKDKQILNQAMDAIPGLRDTVNNIQAYQAAKDLTPVMRSLPQTGMGASIASGFLEKPLAAGIGTSYLTKSPVLGALAGAGMMAKNAITSPRLSFAAMKLGQQLGSAIGSGAGSAIFPATTVAGQATTRGILTNYAPSPTTPAGE